MTKLDQDKLTQLRVGEGWIRLRVHGEPYVLPTRRRYEPVLQVEDLYSRTRHFLYMSAKSFMDGLEPLRERNGGVFDRLEFRIRKESDDRYAPFVIEQ